MTDASPPPVARVVLALVFFLSGATALIFEALWFHQAGLTLGHSVWATSLVLAGFMGGLALGNGLVGRHGYRIRRPLRVYGAIEAAVGLSGMGLVYLLPVLNPVLAPLLTPLLDMPWPLNLLRLGVAFLLLLFPATAMGATLPLVVAALFRHDRRFGSVLGRLYGWNTLGAVCGVLAVDLLLLPALGVRGSAWLALGLNLAACAGAYALAVSGFGESGQPSPASIGRLPAAARRQVAALLVAAFVCGGILLALEVVWFRFLQLFVLGTGTAFALMLATVLAGIALGGLLAAAWLARRPAAAGAAAWLALLAGATVVAAYLLLDRVAYPLEGQAAQGALEVLRLALPLMLPVSVLSGMVFTLLGEDLNRVMDNSTRAAGYLTLANTAGAMAGSALAGLALLPALGMERAVQALALSYVPAAALMLWGRGMASSRRPGGRQALALGAGLVALLGLAGMASGMMKERYLEYPTAYFKRAEGARIGMVREGLTETAILMDVERFDQPLYQRLVTNAFSMSATTYPSRRYMSLFAYLPMAVSPQPRRALLISYGVGITAGALVKQDSLESIDVVDISRDILETSAVIHGVDDDPLADPRVAVHVEDGRFFLQTRDETFDLITGEPPPPRIAGIVNLYTAEYFRLLAARLSPGGVASYWLPVHSLHLEEAQAITAAFCGAFPDCSLWSGAGWDWLLLGRREGTRTTATAHDLWSHPRLGPDLRTLGVENAAQMAALFMADAALLADWYADVPPLADDRPRRFRSAEPTPAETARDFAAWTDAGASWQRFRRSGWVQSALPPGMARAPMAAFAAQHDLNRLMYGEAPGLPATLPAVHRLLEESDLETLPLLLCGTDPQVLEAVSRARAAGHPDPGLLARQGLMALSRRDLPAARDRLTAAWRAGDRRPSTAWALVYTLSVAGQIREAEAVAAGSGLLDDATPAAARARALLTQRFGFGR